MFLTNVRILATNVMYDERKLEAANYGVLQTLPTATAESKAEEESSERFLPSETACFQLSLLYLLELEQLEQRPVLLDWSKPTKKRNNVFTNGISIRP